MQGELAELFVHAAAFLLYGIVATALAGIGAFFEYRSYVFLTGGELFLAAWMGALGLVALAFAYLVTRDKALPAGTKIRPGQS